MIALKKEAFDLLKKEGLYVLYFFLISLLIFKIAFFNDSIVVTLRTVLSIFGLFVAPGYFIMLYWHEKLDFVQRMLVGVMLAAGLMGIISYYLGLTGLNIKFHTILLPMLTIISGFLLYRKLQ